MHTRSLPATPPGRPCGPKDDQGLLSFITKQARRKFYPFEQGCVFYRLNKQGCVFYRLNKQGCVFYRLNKQGWVFYRLNKQGCVFYRLNKQGCVFYQRTNWVNT